MLADNGGAVIIVAGTVTFSICLFSANIATGTAKINSLLQL